jgi:hypothetical protein
MDNKEIKSGLVLLINGLIKEAKSHQKIIKEESGTFKAVFKSSYKETIKRIKGLFEMAEEYLNAQEYEELKNNAQEYEELKKEYKKII